MFMSIESQRLRLEIRHLRTIAAIRDTGTIAAAAKRLHLTQSALSHQLRTMEEQLGGPILARGKRRPLRFTAVGQRLVQLADEVLPRIEATERDIHELASGHSGRLHIAIECHSCFEWLLPAMDKYRERWPEIELDLSLAYSLDPLPALVDGVIDLVITSDPIAHPGVSYTPLFRYQSVLVLAKDHPLADKPYIDPADLADQTLITYPVARQRLDIFNHFLEPAGIEVAAVRTAELTSMIVQLVASRRGVSALPAWAIDKYLLDGFVITRPLGADGMWATLHTAVRREQAELPFMLGFIELASTLPHDQLHNIEPATSAA